MIKLEILYIIVFAIITLFTVLAYTRKMSTGIALFSLLTGIGIVWTFNAYMQMMITPLSNVIFFSYEWSYLAFMVLVNVILIILALIVRAYNLTITGGKIGWA